MNAIRFDVLIHAPFYSALRAETPDVRARFRRLVDRLRAGHWGGGTRVKKLRGCAKPVFEARQDAGDRVLFTLAHTAARDASDALRAHLMLWDLVHHDRVSGAAHRVNPSAEAEFLSFEALEDEETSEPPPYPAASFPEVAAWTGGEAGVFELMLADGEAPRAREEITGGVRWYVLPDHLLLDDAHWQALLDRGADELELKLTSEQYAVVRAPGPVLLSGSAGSGKTTIAVHRLAAAIGSGAGVRALYLTYSPWLRDHAARLFEDLIACRGEALAVAPEFLTVHELYRALIAAVGGAAPAAVVDYPEFARWYDAQFRRSDAALAWEEIRGIVKGASLDPARALLSRDDYEALGRKRAPAFVGEREHVHRVARQWQERLAMVGRIDEIDLCRRALATVPRAGLYDHLVCDEAQDLAEIQMELLLRLVPGRALGGLFLAGDPQQVINPSGFRWAEVRSRIRERFIERGRPAPEIIALTRNFRSVRGLVELANEVIAFKRDRTGRSEGDETEESEVAGAAPILVLGGEADLADAVRGFGPRCAVVVGSAELRERLQAELGTTRVFTVPEAKGLEFDVAVLWSVVAADPAPWQRLLDPSVGLREDPPARRALHHLYVAVTRARRHLAIYEPDGAPALWASERFAAHLDSESPASLARLFARSAAPGEWGREGEYFLARARYRQAAECFRRAGDARRESESLARHHEVAGEPALAAVRWRALGETVSAARCFEAAEEWADAAADWTVLGDAVGAGRCRARGAEATRRFADAAKEWETIEAWDDAGRCWGSAGNRRRQIHCLALAADRTGNTDDAARRWEEIGDWDRAATAWRRAGHATEAHAAEARGHEATRRWAAAATAWDAAGDDTHAARCRAEAAQAAGRWQDAAREWESLAEYDAAIRAWQRAGRADEGQRCAVRRDLAESRFNRAAESLEDLADFAAAAEAWQRADAAGQTPIIVRALPLPHAATRAWSPGGRAARLARSTAQRDGRAPAIDARVRALVCTVRAEEDAERFQAAADAWKALGDPEQAFRCRIARLEHADDAIGAAKLLEKRARYEAAADAWDRLGDPAAAARCRALDAEKQGHLLAAAEAWTALGNTTRAARCRGEHALAEHRYDDAASFLAEDPTSRALLLEARLSAAKLRANYDEASGAMTELAGPDTTPLGDREEWLAEARAFANGHGTGERGRRARKTRRAADETSDLATKIVTAVERQPGSTTEEIAEALEIGTATLRRRLSALVADGRLRKAGRGRTMRYEPA